ncbi:A.superbus venom factor 1-like [Dermacentor silvarum]|uniref:A.superbus venom factor 1-like n=1 Tax=Dermacentor silvarum TaxID=543639 RepID=UPI002100BB3D|nr:A.superbus venom factor 1-like [Dermacentor silvarum]
MKLTRLNPGQTYEATTGSDGVATFFIPVSIDDGVLSIEVATNDQRYPDEHQARERLTLQPYQRVSEGFIAIERKDPKSVAEVNQLYEAVLFIHHVKKISSSVYYAVLSKGRIEMVQKLPEGRRIEENIVIPVTPEMTPSFRVVVFAVLGGNVVTDSIYVNAQPACTNTSHFTLGRKNMGAASEPMALETLVVKGTPGTRVGFLGVDQSLYLLRKKDLLTRDKLFQSLDSKDLGCGAGGGMDAVEALSSSGVVLLTRAHVGNTLRSDIACHEHRRKREAAINILEKYEDETLRVCCSRDQRRDEFLFSCAERVEILMKQENTHVTQECLDAFKRCCTLRELKNSAT